MEQAGFWASGCGQILDKPPGHDERDSPKEDWGVPPGGEGTDAKSEKDLVWTLRRGDRKIFSRWVGGGVWGAGECLPSVARPWLAALKALELKV